VPRKQIPDSLVEQLLRRGMTDTAVVDYLAEHENVHVTRQAISIWRKRKGLEMKRRQPPRALPFDQRPEHRTKEAPRVIRLYAKVQRGESISKEDQRRLDRALEALGEDKVFYYDEEDGWFLTSRTAGDEGIVRLPRGEEREHGEGHDQD